MKKLRLRLVNSGEDLLDLQKTKEVSADKDNEKDEAVAVREYVIVDQDPSSGMISADVDEVAQNDQRVTLGRIDQRINKAQIHRGWIKRYGRKHKRVRYTSRFTSNGID